MEVISQAIPSEVVCCKFCNTIQGTRRLLKCGHSICDTCFTAHNSAKSGLKCCNINTLWGKKTMPWNFFTKYYSLQEKVFNPEKCRCRIPAVGDSKERKESENGISKEAENVEDERKGSVKEAKGEGSDSQLMPSGGQKSDSAEDGVAPYSDVAGDENNNQVAAQTICLASDDGTFCKADDEKKAVGEISNSEQVTQPAKDEDGDFDVHSVAEIAEENVVNAIPELESLPDDKESNNLLTEDEQKTKTTRVVPDKQVENTDVEEIVSDAGFKPKELTPVATSTPQIDEIIKDGTVEKGEPLCIELLFDDPANDTQEQSVDSGYLSFDTSLTDETQTEATKVLSSAGTKEDVEESDGIPAYKQFICFGCDGELFCGNCVRIHNKLPATRSHKAVCLDDISDQEKLLEVIKTNDASSHTACPSDECNQSLDSFCMTCDKFVCKDCMREQHKSHIIRTIERASQHGREAISKLSSKLGRKLDILNSQVSDEEKVSRNDGVDAHKEFHEQIVSEIDAISAKMKQQVESQFEEYSDQLSTLQTRVGGMQQRNDYIQLFYRSAAKICDDHNIVHTSQTLMHILKTFWREVYAEKGTTPSKHNYHYSFPTIQITKTSAESLMGKSERTAPPANLLRFGPTVGNLEQEDAGGLNPKIAARLLVSELKEITGLDVNHRGSICIAGPMSDPSVLSHVYIFAANGSLVKKFPTAIRYPSDLKVCGNIIYVSDYQQGYVVGYKDDGKMHKMLKVPGMSDKPGKPSSERLHLAVDNFKTLYVLHKDIFFCPEGREGFEILKHSDKYRDLQNPVSGFDVCPQHGFVMLSSKHEKGRNRPAVLTIKHAAKAQRLGTLCANNQSSPADLCCDAKGNIYYVDDVKHQLALLAVKEPIVHLKANSSKSYKADKVKWQKVLMENSAKLSRPSRVCISPDDKYLLVVHGKNQLSVFALVQDEL